MLSNRRNCKFLSHFKFNSEKSMAGHNQKNLSQMSMLKIDDPYQIAGKMRGSKQIHDFVYSFRPMYYFSRFLGLLPFSFVYDSNGLIEAPRIRICDGVWFVISVAFYFILAMNSSQVIEIPYDAAPLVTLSNSLLLTIGLFNASAIIVLSMGVRFRFVTILKKITRFDKEASQNENQTIMIVACQWRCSVIFMCAFVFTYSRC